MRNVLKFLIFALVMVNLTSCDPDEKINPTPGGENPGSGEDKVLWTYEIDGAGNFDDVPAIDEQGNIYGGRKSDLYEKSDLNIFSIDKNGHERWKKSFADVFTFSKIVYKDNKIFFLTHYAEVFQHEDGSIFCLDAATGNVIWEKKTAGIGYIWGRLAVADNRIYVHSNTDEIGSPTLLIAYDFSGNKLGSFSIADDSATTGGTLLHAISVLGNKVYYSSIRGGGQFQITRLTETDGVFTVDWRYEYDDVNNSVIYSGMLHDDLPMDDDGNTYFTLLLRSDNQRKEAVICVGANGTEKWMYENILDEEINYPIGNVTVSSNGEVYANFRHGMHSISSSGTKDWSLETGFYDAANILKLNYQDQPAIAANGNVYNHDEYGFVAVKNQGSVDWKYLLPNEYIQLADYSTINIDGNLIIMGNDKIVCVKGDGSPLATGGWAKRFGDLGNTCSK